MENHTLIVREGRWRVSGSTVDVAGNANIAVGFLVITNRESGWLLEEQINELTNRYEIERPESGVSTTTFAGENAALGKLTGRFVFFEELILTIYESKDGTYKGFEALTRADPDRYESRGALFLDGGHVSSWSLTLQRA